MFLFSDYFITIAMRNTRNALYILCLLFIACTEKAEQPEHRQSFAAVDAEIERTLEDAGIPGVSIALFRHDSLVYAKAYGYVNVYTQTKADTASLFSTGSLLKPLVSILALRMVDAGTLDLDVPITNYLLEPNPCIAEADPPITLRHLLSHCSGLPESAPFAPLWEPTKIRPLRKALEQVCPIRPAGEDFMYSNEGFALAAVVLEDVSGRSCEALLADLVFAPAKLNGIPPFGLAGHQYEHVALPYRTVYNLPKPVVPEYSEAYPAGGNTYLTPSQYGRILTTFLDTSDANQPPTISHAMRQALTSLQFENTYYGLGIGIETNERNEKIVFHNGMQIGYTAAFKRNQETSNLAVVMCNTTSEAAIDALSNWLLHYLDTGHPAPPLPSFKVPVYEALKISANDLAEYAGSYTLPHTPLNLVFAVTEGKPVLINPEGLQFALTPFDDGAFFLNDEEATVRFTRLEGGELQLTYSSAEGEFKAKRTKQNAGQSSNSTW